jgi:tyrosine-specific transport protein
MLGYFRNTSFRHAVALLVGTMVGVGIYGIPFAFAKAGFLVGAAWLVGLSLMMLLVHLLLAELTLSTEGKHQLIGYAHIWLGHWGRRAMAFAQMLTIYGALLAYMIVFGEFAHTILSQFFAVDPQLYSLGFALGWSLLWLVRLRTMAAVETGLIVGYASIIGFIVILCAPHIQHTNLSGWMPEFWFLPYGVILFALGGATAVPLQRELLAGQERLLWPAILWSSGIVAGLYILFAAAIVGVSGEVTSPEALAGLYGLVPTAVLFLGSVLGVFTISTSYIALGTALCETYRLDYRLSPGTAWVLAVVPPIIFFWSGLRNFIDVIGLVGAVAGGLQGVLLLAAFLRARRVRLRHPEFRVRIPVVVVWGLMLLFAGGVVYELWIR